MGDERSECCGAGFYWLKHYLGKIARELPSIPVMGKTYSVNYIMTKFCKRCNRPVIGKE